LQTIPVRALVGTRIAARFRWIIPRAQELPKAATDPLSAMLDPLSTADCVSPGPLHPMREGSRASPRLAASLDAPRRFQAPPHAAEREA
jgi:hypothetical protein